MNNFNFENHIQKLPMDLGCEEFIAAKNKIVATEFPLAVARVGWKLLTTDSPPAPASGKHVIVVCVVTYSKEDLHALDFLVQRGLPDSTVVLVLDLAFFLTTDAVLRVVPGIPAPIQTPIMAEYYDGKLIKTLEGPPVIDWCRE